LVAKQQAEHIMADDNNERPATGTNARPATGTVGLMVGGAFALAAVVFMLVGGQFGGEKKVHGDQDMPPIASPEKK
jgi:hypothetical protein